MKYYAVILFYRKHEIRDLEPNEEDTYINKVVHFQNNSLAALDFYANIPNPASQFIEATNPVELEQKVVQMIENYKSEEWLQENLYPFL